MSSRRPRRLPLVAAHFRRRPPLCCHQANATERERATVVGRAQQAPLRSSNPPNGRSLARSAGLATWTPAKRAVVIEFIARACAVENQTRGRSLAVALARSPGLAAERVACRSSLPPATPPRLARRLRRRRLLLLLQLAKGKRRNVDAAAVASRRQSSAVVDWRPVTQQAAEWTRSDWRWSLCFCFCFCWRRQL